MTTYSAFTTMPGEEIAIAISDALEAVVPEPTGIGVFEMEDGSGLWEVGAYFDEKPDVFKKEKWRVLLLAMQL